VERRTAAERRWLALAVLCLSLVLVVVDNTILNVALPTLGRDLDASTSDLQWMVDSYVLVFAGLLLTAGSLGDRFGRRRALTGGLVIFGLASVASAFAGSSTQLIATRAVMGVGAAFVMPSTLSIISNLFTDPVERARAIAIWAGCAGLGVAIGPLSGGTLLEHYWWGAVFLVNVPVVGLALIGGRALLPESSDPDHARIDVPGAALSIAGLALLIWSLIEAGNDGWTEPAILGGFAASAIVLGGFAWWERRTDHPMLDLTFFENPRFSAATGSITVVMFAMFGSFFLLTQLLQLVLGYSALEAGVRMLPFAVTMAVVGPASARLVERVGTKVVVAGGMTIAAVGLLLTGRIEAGDGYLPVALAMFVQAAGMALVFAPATESIMGSVPPAKAGVGSAVNDTTRELGGALGVAVLGSLLSSAFASRMADIAAPAAARESLGAALAVATTLPGQAGAQLADAARAAFVDGMGITLAVAAAVLVAGAIGALVLLPSRATSAEADMADELVDEETAFALDAA
jgi:EmrB/QacA subfamily drug resistance transporter